MGHEIGVQRLVDDETEEVPAFLIFPPVATSLVPADPPDELKIKQHHGPRRNAHILLHPGIPSSMNDLIKLESGLGHPPVYLVKSDVSYSRYSLKCKLSATINP